MFLKCDLNWYFCFNCFCIYLPFTDSLLNLLSHLFLPFYQCIICSYLHFSHWRYIHSVFLHFLKIFKLKQQYIEIVFFPPDLTPPNSVWVQHDGRKSKSQDCNSLSVGADYKWNSRQPYYVLTTCVLK